MTDLLSPPDAPSAPSPSEDVRRPLAIGAGIAGGVASGAVLMACMALGLVAWFASDAGAHGDTRDAIRIGADGWLLAQGAHLDLTIATITLTPLGLTALCAYVAFRLGRWAGLTSDVEDARTALLGSVVMAGIYGVVVMVTAVLASIEQAQPHLFRAFVGGFVVAFLGGGLGIVSGSGLLGKWRLRLPETLVAITVGAVSAVLMMFAASALLLATALVLDLGPAANVLSQLHTDTSGALLYLVVVAAVAPNAALMSGAYLLGPGFAVGTGTIVSPSVVVLGPLPAFPLLAALPDNGPTPWWTTLLVAVPVALGLLAAALMTRRFPVPGYELGAVRGLGAGAGGGLLLGLLVAAAGGAVGPGRMADVGAPLIDTLVAATVAMGVGGLVGGVFMTWWVRRQSGR
jgi:Family of unknown function (DUF6350)